jgi:hypothetical protein
VSTKARVARLPHGNFLAAGYRIGRTVKATIASFM